MRDALVIGTLFLRRGRKVTLFLTVITGCAVAIALSGLVGLGGFLGHVSSKGDGRYLGIDSDEQGGCIQSGGRYDPYRETQYDVELLAAACDDPVVPPGLARFPQAGQVFLSPALARLQHTDSDIATRFPRVDGTIGRRGLTGSDELYAIVGIPPVAGELPVGFSSADGFGSHTGYIAGYLRIGIPTLLIIGFFFTLLPSALLIAACSRLNARSRERQHGILAIIGVDGRAMRRASVCESVLTVGAGAVVGVLLARPVLARATPMFVAWKAFPGDMLPPWFSAPLIFLAVLGLAMVGASWGARRRRRTASRTRALSSSGWRWGLLVVGLACAAVAVVWHSQAEWPLTLVGRLATFAALLSIGAVLCAAIGERLTRSDNAEVSLVGARLRRPSGSLTRALAALAAGLFVLSGGLTLTQSNITRQDPIAIQQAYSADGYSVVQVRRPSDEVRQVLAPFDGMVGRDGAEGVSDPGTLRGSCATLSRTVGARVDCSAGILYSPLYPGEEAPRGSRATAMPYSGARPDALPGYVIDVAGSAAIAPGDDEVYVPLPVRQADRLYDRLVAADPAVSAHVVGEATVSGSSELVGILDVFRWGGSFAVLTTMLAVLVSLEALLLDRQSGSSYLQVLGMTGRRVRAVVLAEVATAAGAMIAVAFFASWLWALDLGPSEPPIPIIDVALPFVVAFVVLLGAAAAVIWGTARSPGSGVVPDRDGLAAVHDAYEPDPRVPRQERNEEPVLVDHHSV